MNTFMIKNRITDEELNALDNNSKLSLFQALSHIHPLMGLNEYVAGLYGKLKEETKESGVVRDILHPKYYMPGYARMIQIARSVA